MKLQPSNYFDPWTHLLRIHRCRRDNQFQILTYVPHPIESPGLSEITECYFFTSAITNIRNYSFRLSAEDETPTIQPWKALRSSNLLRIHRRWRHDQLQITSSADDVAQQTEEHVRV